MKKIHLILPTLFSFFTLLLAAQVPKETVNPISTISSEQINKSNIGRGSWQNFLRQNVDYAHFDNSIADQDFGKTSSASIDLGTNYFVTDHIAVGMELNVDWDKTDIKSIVDIVSKTTSWMAYANLTYMTNVSDHLNIYIRPSVGFGGMSDKQTYMGTTETDKSDIFALKIEAGAPISIYNHNAINFTPEFQFRYRTENFDGGKEKDSQFGFGFFLESYLRCSQMGCDKNRKYSTNMYDRGSTYLGYNTKGMISFGSTKATYDNYPDVNEDNYFRAKLETEFMYYVIPNLALGTSLNFRQSSIKTKDTDLKQTMGFWYLQPTFEFNFPGKSAINNLFLRGGVGFGGTTLKYENPLGTTKEKDGISAYDIGLGYNIFYTKRLALTPMIHYRSEKLNPDSSEDDQKNKGFEFQLGVRTFF